MKVTIVPPGTALPVQSRTGSVANWICHSLHTQILDDDINRHSKRAPSLVNFEQPRPKIPSPRLHERRVRSYGVDAERPPGLHRQRLTPDQGSLIVINVGQ